MQPVDVEGLGLDDYFEVKCNDFLTNLQNEYCVIVHVLGAYVVDPTTFTTLLKTCNWCAFIVPENNEYTQS